MRRQPAHHPNDGCENQAGEREVGGKPVLADIDALDQSGGHHPPADSTLKPTQHQKAEQRPAQPSFHSAGHQKNMNGTANNTPTPRASSRCAHSHQ
jgi:hypothetical protein